MSRARMERALADCIVVARRVMPEVVTDLGRALYKLQRANLLERLKAKAKRTANWQCQPR